MITMVWLLVMCALVVVCLSQCSVFLVLSPGGEAAGQLDSSSLRKAGPSIQTSLSAKATAESPLVGRSAGLTVPGSVATAKDLLFAEFRQFDWQMV